MSNTRCAEIAHLAGVIMLISVGGAATVESTAAAAAGQTPGKTFIGKPLNDLPRWAAVRGSEAVYRCATTIDKTHHLLIFAMNYICSIGVLTILLFVVNEL